jgi:zinc D-Ala-D-Ala carboxypeptidase
LNIYLETIKMTEQEAKRVKLSENFTLWEFLNTKHKDLIFQQLKISEEHIENLRELCVNVLQPLRNHVGRVEITSGYRCKALNERIKGARNSEHMYGFAADFRCADMPKAFEFIKTLKFRQLINEYDFAWIHVSFNPNDNKKQILST